MRRINTRREKFFQEALKLIYEKGFKATTMRNIAERMDFEVANIYNYIDSKQQLLEVFLDEIAEEFHENIDDIQASSYSPAEKIKAIIALRVSLPFNKPYQVSLLLNEWRNLDEPKRSKFLARKDEYEEKLKLIVEEGMAKGEFRQMDPDVATHTILSAVRWLYTWYTNPDNKKINPIEMQKQITDFVFQGMGIQQDM